jgi:hypothetical protein
MSAVDRLRRIEQREDASVVPVYRADLRIVLDRLEELEALEQRVTILRDELQPVGNRAPGPQYRLAVQLLGGT